MGIYRGGPKLESLMRTGGVRMSIGSLSRLATLVVAIEGVMNAGDVDTLRRIVEAAVNPADFIGDLHKAASVVDHLNTRLAFDGLSIGINVEDALALAENTEI